MSIKYFTKYSPFMVNTLAKSNPLVCKSQRLMLDYGFIQACGTTGFYNILPLGQRVLDKLCALIQNTMEERVGALKVSLSCLTSTEIWKQSGRLEDAWPELFVLKDRNDRQLCLNPTHEESVCSALASIMGTHPTFPSPASPQLPLRLYQLGKKFRDEGKPRHGLLRSREFLMADAYAFDADEGGARTTYDHVTGAYAELFTALAGSDRIIRSEPMAELGGHDLMGRGGYGSSHEYHVISDVGEDTLAQCPACGSHSTLTSSEVFNKLGPLSGTPPQEESSLNDRLMGSKAAYHSAANSEAPTSQSSTSLTCPSCKYTGPVRCSGSEYPSESKESFRIFNSIEVAHTFHLGTHFTSAFGITVGDGPKATKPCHMTCYGIGVSRLMAALLELGIGTTGLVHEAEVTRAQDGYFDAGQCLKWSNSLVPFRLAIVPPKAGSKEEKSWSRASQFYNQNMGGFIGPSLLSSFPHDLKGEILCDDRCHVTVGRRLQDMRRIGVPLVVVCGRKLLEDIPKFELYNAYTDQTMFLQESDLIPEIGKSLRQLFSPI